MGIFDFLKNKKSDYDDVIYTFDFGKLSFSETMVLSFYAVTNTSFISEYSVRQMIMSECGGFDRNLTLKKLYDKGLIYKKNYIFDDSDYSYEISPEVQIKHIEWLYFTEEGADMLDIVRAIHEKKGLETSNFQIAIIDYVKSNYINTNSAMLIFGADVKPLLSVINNDNYSNLIAHLYEPALLELIQQAIDLAFANTLAIDADMLMSLINSRTMKDAIRQDRFINMLKLYSFITKGTVSESKTMNTKEAALLNGVIKLYKSKYKEAEQAFMKAMVMHNAQTKVVADKGIFHHGIINLLWMVACYRSEKDDAKRYITAMLRNKNTIEEIKAAWAFSAIITNKPGYVTNIRMMFTSANTFTRQLLTLAVMLTGRNDIINEDAYEKYKPEWLLLKFEFDKFMPMDPEEKSRAIEAYTEPQISSIHIKQQWEYVLENLTMASKGNVQARMMSTRIAYVVKDIYDNMCEIRMQTILRNGSWSAGKAITMATFLNMKNDDLTDADQNIRNRVSGKYYNSFINVESILEYMTKDSRLYVGRYAPYTLVTVNEEMPYLVIERSDNGFSIKSNVPVEDVDKKIIIVSRSASSINFLKMSDELRPYFSQLLELSHFPTEAEESLSRFLEGLRGKVEVHSTLIKGGSTLNTVKGSSNITLQMRPQGKEAYMVSVFCRALQEGRVQCVPGEGSSVIIDVEGDHRVCVERDLEKEHELYDNMKSALQDALPEETTFQVDAYGLLPIIDFVRENSENYNLEWPEGQKLNIIRRYTASQWTATLKKNKNGWFEMEGNVQLDENTFVSMNELMEMINMSKGRFIRLAEGEYIALSERLRKQLSTIDAIASRSRNKLQMSPFSAALLDNSITNGELILEVDDELKEIRQRILDSSTFSPDIPKTLNATLRSYQKEGFQWIARLNSWGAGALLADDMGLGKTIQTITYMLYKAEEGPALVVAPASVAPNWKTEFEKFAPSLNVQILNFATNRSTCIAEAKAGDVVITTYGLLLSVKLEITQKHWTTICLDEAHVIKNRGAKTSGVAMQLKSDYRIMLTGTPVQNHLGELWNLFQFVNPGLLGSYEDFGRRFITPIEVGGDKERQKELDKIVHPFMLRRTKEKVLKELPEKTEIYQSVELTQEELAVYEVIRKKAEEMLKADGAEKVSVNTLAEITRLRQAACSAKLIEKTWKGKTSKIEALMEALEPIVESGDAALVFSQFTSFLALVKKALDKVKMPYLYIDGSVSVKERQALVKKFQDGECPIFIISLKAGGLGLNLTKANYVFHLDPWWNPAIEQQATDRAHRMGQHQNVTVYHFLSANTIEEKIRRLHEHKRDLADNILEGTDMSSKLTGKDLLEMVREV